MASRKLLALATYVLPLSMGVGAARAQNMYWTDYDRSKVQRSDLRGTDIQHLITDDSLYPAGIALDTRTDKMYWSAFTDGKIQRANLNGSDVEDAVTGLETPERLAIDETSRKIYWADWSAGKSSVPTSTVRTLKTSS